MEKVSVIVTVFNEENTIESLLNALQSQTKKPDEVVIVDAVSTDNTWEILKKYASKNKYLKIFQKPGIRSVGRNEAIKRSTGKIIAITDAGCIPEKNWLSEIAKPFQDSKVEVVSGFYKGIYSNDFEKCLLPYVLVMPDKAKDDFFPSTRSMAMRRMIYEVYGGFNERFDPSEDYEYAVRLHKRGIKFFFAQKAIVGWLPRKNIQQAFWMFLRFAAGDVIANVLRPKIKWLALRYLAFFYLFFIAIQLPKVFIFLTVLAVAYMIWAIAKNYKYCKVSTAIFWLPVLQITADIGVLLGTIMGFLYKMGTPKQYK